MKKPDTINFNEGGYDSIKHISGMQVSCKRCEHLVALQPHYDEKLLLPCGFDAFVKNTDSVLMFRVPYAHYFMLKS